VIDHLGAAATLLDRISDLVVAKYDTDRRESPYRFIGSPDGLGPSYLFVENVAHMLGCGVDYVRRIPRTELPASKVGARVIYQRSDVAAFIASRRDQGTAAKLVPARKLRMPIERKHLQLVATEKADSFDPVSFVRSLTKREKSTK
jgi:hypothetical protein